MLKLSTGGLAFVTIACVLAWCGLVAGAGALAGNGLAAAFAALLVIPLLPGAPACIVAGGAHSNGCLPAMLIGNVAFYLWLVFRIRKRQLARDSRSI
jgi:hypothetical protein